MPKQSNNPELHAQMMKDLDVIKSASSLRVALFDLSDRRQADVLTWEELEKILPCLQELRDISISAGDMVIDLIRARNAQSVSGRLASERKKNRKLTSIKDLLTAE